MPEGDNPSGMSQTLASFIGNINPIRYRGYYYDTDLGLYYLQSRYYDPETGRFVNADSVGTANNSLQGFNLYVYCNNDPVNMSDPDGHWPKWFSDVGSVIKKAFDGLVNTIKSIAVAAFSFKFQAGFGTGLRGSASVGGLEVSGGAKADLLTGRLTSRDVKIGQEVKAGVSVGWEPVKQLQINVEQGYFHSGFCEFFDDIGHNEMSCPNSDIYSFDKPSQSVTLAGFEIYVIIGVSASIEFDTDYFCEQVNIIWSDF